MRKLKLLVLMIPLSLAQLGFSQMRTITGTVKSGSDGTTMPGVSVFAKGTTIGAITDINGKYTLDLPKDKTVVVYSFIGFKNKEVPLTDAITKYDVTIEETSKNLDEVVITANSIKREKRSLGYAATQVKADDLTKGQNTNVLGGLQGKVAGVNITSLSGAAGGSNRVVIRGGSSITGNNQALFIVDGIAMNNDNRTYDNPLQDQVDFGNKANDINPQDIESVTILQGGAASALYGSRASNGVILITTKKGGKVVGGQKKMNITVNSNTTFANVLKYPTFQNIYGQGDVNNTFNDRRENFSWGLPFDGELRPWGQEINGQSRVKPYSALPNNVKDFFQTGITNDNTLAFSGGGTNTDYYLSINGVNSRQITPGTRYQKYGVRFNGNSSITEKLKAGININYITDARILPNAGQGDVSVFNNLIQTPRDIPITEGSDLDNIYNSYNDATGKYGFYGAYTLNPYANLQNNITSSNNDRVIAGITLSYDPFEWLNITERIGEDAYSERRFQKFRAYDYAPYDPFYEPAGNKTYQGKYSEDFTAFNQTDHTLTATFKKNFSDNFTSSLLVGNNIFATKSVNTFSQTNDQGGLIVPTYFNLSNSNGPAKVVSDLQRNRIVGLFGQLDLGYKNFIFLGLTGRNDWSSTLPIDARSYFYSGANLSFVFSEFFGEKLKNDVWNFAKVRASYSKVGKSTDPYQLQNYLSPTDISGGFGSTIFPLNTVPGFSANDLLGNEVLKPEYTIEYEVGATFAFLQDRITIDAAYYSRQSKDQIFAAVLSNATGFENKKINSGEFTNKGVELTFNLTPFLTPKGFRWDTYFTYTQNISEVVSLTEGLDILNLPGGTASIVSAAAVGQPYTSFYAIDLLTNANGNVVIDTTSGLPKRTTKIVNKGTTAPKFQASWGNSFSYKSFSFATLVDCRIGGIFYSRTKSTMGFVGTSLETTDGGRDPRVWENSVYEEIDPQGNIIYKPNLKYKYDPYDYFTAGIPDGQNIIDASYFKIREISIGYALPRRILDKTFLGSATIGLFANNLFIVTANENLYADPEMSSNGTSNTQGFEFSALPSQRNYGINLKLSF